HCRPAPLPALQMHPSSISLSPEAAGFEEAVRACQTRPRHTSCILPKAYRAHLAELKIQLKFRGAAQAADRRIASTQGLYPRLQEERQPCINRGAGRRGSRLSRLGALGRDDKREARSSLRAARRPG